MRSILPLLLSLVLTAAAAAAVAADRLPVVSVSLPLHYTAMEGDIEASFVLVKPNAFEHNAMIHLEYLEFDSILPAQSVPPPRPPKRLSSLPVPLGLSAGVVVFQCGSVRHAGPHRAFLTVDGKRVAESDVVQVAWPPLSITSPSRLRAYGADVSVTVAFTRSLCITFATSSSSSSSTSSSRKSSSPGFSSRLDLVECSKSIVNPEGQDCQAPSSLQSSSSDKRIWLSHDVPNLYQKSSFTLTLNCSVWGQSGTFRLFLRTNLSHASVVARSAPIVVSTNPSYSIESVESQFVFPCLAQDIKPLSVRRPQCAGLNDRIRVYGQGYQVVGEGNLIPSQWDYLGEKRISKEEDLVFIPCEYFSQRYWRFCFHYVTISLVGTTDTLSKLCLPAKDDDSSIAVSTWSDWNEWSDCSKTCGTRGIRSRYRVCQLPANATKRILCEGQRVEQRPCTFSTPCPYSANDVYEEYDRNGSSSLDNLSTIWRPLFEEKNVSPCSCGCIYIVGRQRQVRITSGRECSTAALPLRWKVKVKENQTMSVRISLIQPSCLDAVVNVRDGDEGGGGGGFGYGSTSGDEDDKSSSSSPDLVNQFGFFDRANGFAFNSSGSVATFELRASNRTCQINMELEVFAKDPVAAPGTTESFFHSLHAWALLMYDHFPFVVLFLLALLLVLLCCCLFLLCQFEYRRKKYVAWKSQPSSGYSTPTQQGHEGGGGVKKAGKDYIALEDIETAHSSVEELMPPTERRRMLRQKRRLLKRLRIAFPANGGTQQQQQTTHPSRRRFSLPTSPYLTRRTTPTSPVLPQPRRPNKLITAQQVKKALSVKSGRECDASLINCGGPRRMRPPLPTPTLLGARNRASRSLSDILGFLEAPTAKSTASSGHCRPKASTRGTSRSRRHLTTFAAPKPLHGSIQRLSHTAAPASSTGLSRSSSRDTLKPSSVNGGGGASSLSEFSVASNTNSGDLELELDLYDYNLDNVVSGQPGSMFGWAAVGGGNRGGLLDFDATPTEDDEDAAFQVTELFPHPPVSLEDCVKRRPRRGRGQSGGGDNEEGEGEAGMMLRSRTSDLTASVTSADLIRESREDDDEEEEEDCAKETDNLLAIVKSVRGKATILNLTHIDDDNISFADSGDENVNADLCRA